MALSWSLDSSGTGYKVIKASVTNGTAGTAIVVKNTGAILSPVASSTSFTGVDQQYLSATLLYVSIADTITDFAAYFVSNPYKLHYKLAVILYHVDYLNNDITKPLLSPGSVISMNAGIGQVEQMAGVKFNESIKPIQSGANWYVNDTAVANSNLSAKAKAFLAKKQNWLYSATTANGLEKAYIANANYDPTSLVFSTYEMLDKYKYCVDTFSVSNPTIVKAYSYKEYFAEQNIGYFSFLANISNVNECKEIAWKATDKTALASLSGLAAWYRYLPYQGAACVSALHALNSTRMLVTTAGTGYPSGATARKQMTSWLPKENWVYDYFLIQAGINSLFPYPYNHIFKPFSVFNSNGTMLSNEGSITYDMSAVLAEPIPYSVAHLNVVFGIVKSYASQMLLRVGTRFSKDINITAGRVCDYDFKIYERPLMR